ncbi:hypothetical protein U9M48_027854 [Paspalum notatum var. saurae]|uniref:Uncharacterized protein n=1 Tax=Paspalum notatum var. saurae TaxID=547442 RepID=A0AAQ3TX78_PASNO
MVASDPDQLHMNSIPVASSSTTPRQWRPSPSSLAAVPLGTTGGSAAPFSTTASDPLPRPRLGCFSSAQISRVEDHEGSHSSDETDT